MQLNLVPSFITCLIMGYTSVKINFPLTKTILLVYISIDAWVGGTMSRHYMGAFHKPLAAFES